MEIKTELDPNSYWQNQTYAILKELHPYKFEVESRDDIVQFIIDRANEVHKFSVDRMAEGIPRIFAMEEARNSILLAGLKFSPTEFIKEVVFDNFQESIDNIKSVSLYLKTKQLFIDRNVNEDIYNHPDNEERLTEDLLQLISADFK